MAFRAERIDHVEVFVRDIDAARLAGDIRQAIAQRHQLQLHNVELVDPGSLPRTSSGKLQRHAARAAYLASALPAIDEALPPPPDRTLADVER